MAETVRLFGGPWHGRLTGVHDGSMHFHVVEPVEDAIKAALEGEPEEGFQPVPIREGMYSRVGNSHDFEGDGWRGHDDH